MPYQHPRPPSALASVLTAAGIVLAVASCTGHITPLGPDQAATMPPPHHLRSLLILQDMRTQGPAPAGLRRLPGRLGHAPRAESRPVLSQDRHAGNDHLRSGLPGLPIPAARAPRTAGTTRPVRILDHPARRRRAGAGNSHPDGSRVPGPSHRQRCHLSYPHSRHQRRRPHLGPPRLRDTVRRPAARSHPAQQEPSPPASAHAGRVRLRRQTSWFISGARSASPGLPRTRPGGCARPGSALGRRTLASAQRSDTHLVLSSQPAASHPPSNSRTGGYVRVPRATWTALPTRRWGRRPINMPTCPALDNARSCRGQGHRHGHGAKRWRCSGGRSAAAKLCQPRMEANGESCHGEQPGSSRASARESICMA